MSSEELIYINWREMIKPEKVQLESKKSYGKFVCEPLERGFGITLGNSLRRIILSSLYGAAIVSVNSMLRFLFSASILPIWQHPAICMISQILEDSLFSSGISEESADSMAFLWILSDLDSLSPLK